MEFGIGFECGGVSKGWLADSAEEARMVIDVLDGKITPEAFLNWVMQNMPQWVEVAQAMLNQCVVGA